MNSIPVPLKVNLLKLSEMKILLKLFLIIVLVSAGLQNQAQVRNFTFGPKIGFSSTTLTTNIDTLENKFMNGMMGGIFFRFSSSLFYIQPEVLFLTKGGIYESSTNQFKEEVYLKTLDVPLIFGIRLIPKESFNIRLHAGPSFSYIIDRKIKMNGTELASALADKSLKDTYFGYQIGLGFDIVNFALDIRAEQGMGSIYREQPSLPVDEWKPLMINVSLALKLL